MVGASRRADSIGHQMLQNILTGGFTGSVYAVNPEARGGPRPAVLRPGRRHRRPGRPGRRRGAGGGGAGRRRATARGPASRRLLVVSAGFAEAGPEGEVPPARAAAHRPDQRHAGDRAELLRGHQHPPGRCGSTPRWRPSCRRPAGSACSPRAAPSASPSSPRPPAAASASRCSPRAGNRVDVSGNDFMQYWIDDDDTDAVGLYLESMGNPRKFSRIARRLASTKPVIVVKSGVSSYGVPPGHRAARDPGAARGVRRDAAPGRGDPGRERPPDVRRRPAGRAPAAARAATGWPSSATPTPSAR